uniref:Exlusion protein FxsA n=1 Tax=uncultured Thiotrichaceae bacterium TaxID=298394 RepID=A0A6S6U4L1_9GAMM|nr:MAG: Exlusion protein FxsA [uncultured Thiotrichaceae bacterium]
MRTFPLFAVLFFLVPLVEIYFLIQVGGVIGVLPTVLLVVLTAVVGAFLLRQQGLSTLARFQSSMGQGKLPATAMFEGVMLIIGGALLMTPGFFTDAIGFACLLPFSRKWLAKAMLSKVSVQQFGQKGATSSYTSYVHGESTTSYSDPRSPESGNQNADSTTIDGDYIRKD